MSRALLVLQTELDRRRAVHWVQQAPAGTRLEFKRAKRSLPQNDFMWSMLGDVAAKLPWHGIKLTPDDWKLIFLDALKRELRVVPNLDGTGFVNLGRSSSDLSKDEMADLLELIREFGARHNIKFIDQRDEDAPSIAPDAPQSPASPSSAPRVGGERQAAESGHPAPSSGSAGLPDNSNRRAS